MSSFHEIFKNRLEELGFSLVDFADKVDEYPNVISLITRGKRKPPIKKVRKWAKALKLAGDERYAFLLAAHKEHCDSFLLEYIENLEANQKK